MGPVEYAIVRFRGNKFDGRITPALGELVEAGTIRLLDLVFIMKDAAGKVEWFEFQDIPGGVTGLEEVTSTSSGLLSVDDVSDIGDDLEPGNSAALIVWEDSWATRLTDAIRAADGELIDHTRIPADVVDAALAAVAGSATTEVGA
jgi:hypothetical protein